MFERFNFKTEINKWSQCGVHSSFSVHSCLINVMCPDQISPGAGVIWTAFLFKPTDNWFLHGSLLFSCELWINWEKRTGQWGPGARGISRVGLNYWRWGWNVKLKAHSRFICHERWSCPLGNTESILLLEKKKIEWWKTLSERNSFPRILV